MTDATAEQRSQSIPTEQIKQLLNQLQQANSLVDQQPLEACQEFVQVTVGAEKLSALENLPQAALDTLTQLQNTASDNLVHAALMATPAADVQDVAPLLESRIHRVNNLINLGFYLFEHQTGVLIGEELYTPQTCAEKALHLEPENEMVVTLVAAVL